MSTAGRFRRFELHKTPRDIDRTLRFVVRSASTNIPAYNKLLAEAGASVERFRGARDLPSLPIIQREMLVLDTPMRDRITRKADPMKCVTRLTSGSDGMPVRVFMSRTEALFRRLLLVLAWGQASQLRFPCTVIDVGVRPDLRTELEIHWHGAIRLVRIPPSSIREVNIRFLSRFRNAILAGYPSSLTLLAEHLGCEAAASLSLRMIATRGEILHNQTRTCLEKTFGCKVVDFYNCEEIGNIAWQCAENVGRLHVNTDACVVEIVDRSGKPLPHGTEGGILLTSLYNCTMPIIRYDIQDRGVFLSSFGEQCSCGSCQPSIGLVQGRDDDFVTLTDGTQVSPRLVATILEQTADELRANEGEDALFRRYQIIQDAVDHVTIRIVPAHNLRVALEQPIACSLKKLDPGMRCTVELVAEVPAAMSGKFRKVMRSIDSPEGGSTL